MTREQLKDAVVEAAQTLMDGGGGPKYHANWNALAIALSDYRALAALDAHTKAEAQEVVTLAVWEDKDGGVTFMRADGLDDRTSQDAWRDGILTANRLGTTVVPITREGGR